MNDNFIQAKKELDQAWQNFELADRGYIDIATLQIKAAQMRLMKIIESEKELVR